MIVFYSWQSDLPAKSNRYAIRDALKKAKNAIKAQEPSIEIEVDEATKRISGSPNISEKIIEKIENADAFVADISTIAAEPDHRPCPNPNVTFELGYAVARLGWERIILLFNEEFGSFPDDLPFDFAQHRAMPFRLNESSIKAEKTSVAKNLETAISAIIHDNPKRPDETRGQSKEKIEHERDTAVIKRFIGQMHIPSIDGFLTEMPHMLDDRVLFFWEGLRGTFETSLFHLYDSVLDTAVTEFISGFRQALSFDFEYQQTPNPDRYIFASPGDSPLSENRKTNWDAIEAGLKQMDLAKAKLLDRIRTSYYDIDIEELSSEAWKKYLEHRTE